MTDLLPDKIFYQHRTPPHNLPSYDAPPGGLDTVEYVRSDLQDEKQGYIGPIEWFKVPGGRIYVMSVGMCFVPDQP